MVEIARSTSRKVGLPTIGGHRQGLDEVPRLRGSQCRASVHRSAGSRPGAAPSPRRSRGRGARARVSPQTKKLSAGRTGRVEGVKGRAEPHTATRLALRSAARPFKPVRNRIGRDTAYLGRLCTGVTIHTRSRSRRSRSRSRHRLPVFLCGGVDVGIAMRDAIFYAQSSGEIASTGTDVPDPWRRPRGCGPQARAAWTASPTSWQAADDRCAVPGHGHQARGLRRHPATQVRALQGPPARFRVRLPAR